MLVVGCWLFVVGCWLLVVGCWLLVVGCWLLVFPRHQRKLEFSKIHTLIPSSPFPYSCLLMQIFRISSSQQQ
ncbi:MAG TPA: hypothetical protein DDZ80_12740 [Cyanobacteria bacterium UBA8803]|nr:hypothetical protein [Cyanobacteria bacterium UBA8803]